MSYNPATMSFEEPDTDTVVYWLSEYLDTFFAELLKSNLAELCKVEYLGC